MRTLGLDVGTKTIGVAVSDELRLTAQGLPTIRRQNKRSDLQALRAFVDEFQVDQLVLGLPLNMDGSEGPRARSVREWGTTLASEFGLPVRYWDERLSTVAAERALLEGNVSRQKRRGLIDRVAAVVILQGFLDAQGDRPAG